MATRKQVKAWMNEHHQAARWAHEKGKTDMSPTTWSQDAIIENGQALTLAVMYLAMTIEETMNK